MISPAKSVSHPHKQYVDVRIQSLS